MIVLVYMFVCYGTGRKTARRRTRVIINTFTGSEKTHLNRLLTEVMYKGALEMVAGDQIRCLTWLYIFSFCNEKKALVM